MFRRPLLSSLLVASFAFSMWACGSSDGPSGLDAGEDASTEDSAVEPSCDDGVQNGNEEGVDCGGSCDPCPTCDDGVQNGDEEGVDCGGSCDPCPTCDDGVQNGDEEGVDCGGSCEVACAECAVDEDCASGICRGASCATTQRVPCVDEAPENATSDVRDVEIQYDEEAGWEAPAACEWSCNWGYCEADGQCFVPGPDEPHEILVELGEEGSVGALNLGVTNSGTQSRGVGQSFTPTVDFALEEVGMVLNNPSGEEIEALLQLRDESGAELTRALVTIPADVSFDWHWFEISHALSAGETYVWTLHLPDALTEGLDVLAYVYSITGIDAYAGGGRYGAITTDESTSPLDAWSPWSAYENDLQFSVRGTRPTCGP